MATSASIFRRVQSIVASVIVPVKVAGRVRMERVAVPTAGKRVAVFVVTLPKFAEVPPKNFAAYRRVASVAKMSRKSTTRIAAPQQQFGARPSTSSAPVAPLDAALGHRAAIVTP